jgi:S-adenosylmethionine synthetase
MNEVSMRRVESAPPARQAVEVVERKGLGHPDTICDAIAEHVCVRLCAHYLDRFGFILHHNVDKSAEAGDDGEVGRGNRANGLITPQRAMTLEAAAGKNPATHAGKLYSIVAGRIARQATDLPGVGDATCTLVSRIGRPLDEPQLADLQLDVAGGAISPALATEAAELVREKLASFEGIREDLLRERETIV